MLFYCVLVHESFKFTEDKHLQHGIKLFNWKLYIFLIVAKIERCAF